MKDLSPICMDIYREQFKEATPSADFDKLRQSGETKKPDWFMKYYLKQSCQDAIMEKHCRKHKLNPRERARVRGTIWLGCSPNGTKPPSEKSIKTTRIN